MNQSCTHHLSASISEAMKGSERKISTNITNINCGLLRNPKFPCKLLNSRILSACLMIMTKQRLAIITLVSFSGMGGLIVGQAIGVYGQNTTSTGNATVDALDKMIYVAIVPTAIAVIGLLQTFAQKGYFNKRTSDAIIMAADASHAVMDTREQFNKYANATYEIGKLVAPEQVKELDEKYAPLIDEIAKKVLEYKPKVQSFEAIAAGSSRAGEKASDSMK